MADYYIHPSAELAEGVVIGAGTKVWNQVQIREEARLGRDCVLSKDVYIDTGVVVGDRVKIQNGVSVYRGVTLEDDVLIGPHAVFTNDLFPRAFSVDWKLVPTIVQRGASIGANATVVCGVTIGEYAMVAAGAVVSTDVPPYRLVVGNPARISARVCRCGHKLRHQGTEGDAEVLVCPRCDTVIRMSISVSAAEIPIFGRPEQE